MDNSNFCCILHIVIGYIIRIWLIGCFPLTQNCEIRENQIKKNPKTNSVITYICSLSKIKLKNIPQNLIAVL